MPELWSEKSRSYQVATYLILQTGGILCDEDFSLDEFVRTVSVCGFAPWLPEDERAMDLATMGKRLPADMMEKINRRYEEREKDDQLPENV